MGSQNLKQGKKPAYNPVQNNSFETPKQFEDRPPVQRGWDGINSPIQIPDYNDATDWDDVAFNCGAIKKDNGTWELSFILGDAQLGEPWNKINGSEYYSHLMDSIPALMYAYVRIVTVDNIRANSDNDEVLSVTIHTPYAEYLIGVLRNVLGVYNTMYSDGK